MSRSHGRARAFFYGCAAHYKRGAEVCGNGLVRADGRDRREVLATLLDDMLRPAVVEQAIARRSPS